MNNGTKQMDNYESEEHGALKVFTKNPFYKKLYDEAPDGAKSYYRNCFVGSLKALGDKYDGADANERLHAILLALTDEDWEYLKSHAPSITIACGMKVAQRTIEEEKAIMANQ